MSSAPETYELAYLPLFETDLADALSYISIVLANPEAAACLLDKAEEAALSLRHHPERRPIYRPEIPRPLPCRWLAVDNYVIFFVIHDRTVELRRFLYKGRNAERRL